MESVLSEVDAVEQEEPAEATAPEVAETVAPVPKKRARRKAVAPAAPEPVAPAAPEPELKLEPPEVTAVAPVPKKRARRQPAAAPEPAPEPVAVPTEPVPKRGRPKGSRNRPTIPPVPPDQTVEAVATAMLGILQERAQQRQTAKRDLYRSFLV